MYPDVGTFVLIRPTQTFYERIKLEVGQRLKVYIKGSKGMGMTFKPTVLNIEPGRELRWIGRLLMPGLFDGEHAFTIEPLDVGRVRFIQSEKFTGLLVFLGTFMGVFRNTQTGFEEMNQALKERSERPPP